MNADLVPALDAAGLPGPTWLFHGLLVLTFFLHLLFMNLTLGGTLIAWFAHLKAGDRPDDPAGVLAGRMVAVNGYAISLAITTGVAPLLFIQTLYQPLFYSGTILLGWIWFALLVLLTAAYYAVYLYKFRGRPARGAGGGIWLGFAAVAFLVIAAIHVAVHLTHVQPERWPTVAESPFAILGDPTFVPRLLHFVLAGVAFSGLVIAWWAGRRAARGGDGAATERAIAATGWRWALWSTVAQVADGFVLLLVLPRDVLVGLMRGGVASLAPLTLAILLGIALLVLLARTTEPADRRGLVAGALGVVTVAIVLMAITRHQIRVLYLEPTTASWTWEVAPQWGNFALFAVLLIAALGTIAYMVRKVLRSPASGDGAA